MSGGPFAGRRNSYFSANAHLPFYSPTLEISRFGASNTFAIHLSNFCLLIIYAEIFISHEEMCACNFKSKLEIFNECIKLIER